MKESFGYSTYTLYIVDELIQDSRKVYFKEETKNIIPILKTDAKKMRLGKTSNFCSEFPENF